MSNGANSIHKELRNELENYIMSQYFGKSPLLLSAISKRIDEEGLLYRKPFIESSPAYLTIKDGIQKANIDEWMKSFFSLLTRFDLGVFSSPFSHQISALDAFVRGEDLFVSTGTGSGKTECFMWPLVASLAREARNSPDTWQMRGVRAIIMYPMNALVSDQVSRLRRMIGDPENKFVSIFREVCGKYSRRPQFGMYTGRTPYPGVEPTKEQDRRLEKTLSTVLSSADDPNNSFFDVLLREGKIPAKADMKKFLERLHEGCHIPDEEDAELITRFEMQQFCPDILITNYSMLEYMLLRPREAKIWSDTKDWLNENSDNKLLFIIDEAHMYKGSSGGEVALLIRRLFHKLGIGRDRVRFILTTASMPDKDERDREYVMTFANELTASDGNGNFCYLTGDREIIEKKYRYDIPISVLLNSDAGKFEDSDENRMSALIGFWSNIDGFDKNIHSLDEMCGWMYDNIILYRPFRELISRCRGNAVSLDELAENIFPGESSDNALKAISVLLAIVPLARNAVGSVLFPARMHMLFKGIDGVYACANVECPHSISDNSLTLGELFLTDGNLTCPLCNSVVYELYNDRRCGALFFKGYILETAPVLGSNVYLWRYHGQILDHRMKEIHLYIPTSDFGKSNTIPKDVKPCYLDIKSGFVNFKDDSEAGKPNIRKLYYRNYSAKGRPSILTFSTCPHCGKMLSSSQLTSFSTKGNLSFFNLIRSQFQLQAPVSGKDNDPERLPNEGRKVLLFSDSRQRAAKLAKDMSDASDISAARQLFAIAVSMMEENPAEQSLDKIYDFFCIAAGKAHVRIFSGNDRGKFADDCKSVIDIYDRYKKRGRDYEPSLSVANAPVQMLEYLLRVFAGGYNTLYDSATCWLEPTKRFLYDAIDSLEEKGIDVSEEDFLEIFNAWIMSVIDTSTALGHTISDIVRNKVRPSYSGYGLAKDWDFPKTICNAVPELNTKATANIWKQVFKDVFLDLAQPDNGKLYIDMSRIKPRFDPDHNWYRCEKCSEITPLMLKGKCPSCGSETIHKMTEEEYDALAFWRKPISEALSGKPIHVINTEEHTAQLSHKDQRDSLWSRTEQYELRFRDIIQDGETPVDILSSTTTMEVGIDIGSLVAVGLRNIPPLRENYQQRAGRAGRRGAALSTIVTFCEDGPHDSLYFKDPVPMLRGDPRRPWIDISSEKLLRRHLVMAILQEFLQLKGTSLDDVSAMDFLEKYADDFVNFTKSYREKIDIMLLPVRDEFDYDKFIDENIYAISMLKHKCENHPELFGSDDNDAKNLLDALYEEGIIPTYSFPKNVVSTYISDNYGKIKYEVERGLDVAIGEYAPGRAIVVDKQTYQIGGLFYPNNSWRRGTTSSVRAFVEDNNYLKEVVSCPKCDWFGLKEDYEICPFCGNKTLTSERRMLRPWGFAPSNGEAISDAQLEEKYSAVSQPIYSTLPEGDEMIKVSGCKNLRLASRNNQRIIMLNKGVSDTGFMVCCDCGAAMPGNDDAVLKNLRPPYKTFKGKKCRHSNTINIDLGYDFITDMLVLEIRIDDDLVDTKSKDNPWIARAGHSLAEALRLAACRLLDVEFSELVAGYRRRPAKGTKYSYVDIYLYDSLSGGAGYATEIADLIGELISGMKEILVSCKCESACSKCLKHYRNQYIHGLLDRHAALDLLTWGTHGERTPSIPYEQQVQMIDSLKNILENSGISLFTEHRKIYAQKGLFRKEIIIYPAMWVEPQARDKIFISDIYIKYAKPYAFQKIIDNI